MLQGEACSELHIKIRVITDRHSKGKVVKEVLFHSFFSFMHLPYHWSHSQWVPGVLSPVVKRLEFVADHSPPYNAEVKNSWSYTSTPQYVFMAWCLVKHMGNFAFTCTHGIEGWVDPRDGRDKVAKRIIPAPTGTRTMFVKYVA
jgi:hypothetical protein